MLGNMDLHKSQVTPLIDTGAAARMLAVSPDTVRRWAKNGKISAVALPSGRFRFRRADIEALLLPTMPSAPSASSPLSSSPASGADKSSFDEPLPELEGMAG